MRPFKCNLRSFLLFLDAPNPKFELSRIGPKKPFLENITKSRFRLNMKTFCLRTSKVSKNELSDILNKFSDNLNVVRGFSVFFFRMGAIKNLNLSKKAEKGFPRKYFQKSV